MFTRFLFIALFSFCLLLFLIIFQDMFSNITFFFHLYAFVKLSKYQHLVCVFCTTFMQKAFFVKKCFSSVYGIFHKPILIKAAQPNILSGL